MTWECSSYIEALDEQQDTFNQLTQAEQDKEGIEGLEWDSPNDTSIQKVSYPSVVFAGFLAVIT